MIMLETMVVSVSKTFRGCLWHRGRCNNAIGDFSPAPHHHSKRVSSCLGRPSGIERSWAWRRQPSLPQRPPRVSASITSSLLSPRPLPLRCDIPKHPRWPQSQWTRRMKRWRSGSASSSTTTGCALASPSPASPAMASRPASPRGTSPQSPPGRWQFRNSLSTLSRAGQSKRSRSSTSAMG